MSGPLNDPENQELFNSNAFVHNPLAGILVVLVAKPLSAVWSWVRKRNS